MAKLQELGEFVRSASSTVEPPVVRKLREQLPQEVAASGGKRSARPSPSAPTAPAAPGGRPTG
jgi:translation initiation factor IF-2